MKALTILEWTRLVLDDHDHWWSGSLAADSCGFTVPPRDPSARRWCLVGSIMAAADALGAGNYETQEALGAVSKVVRSEHDDSAEGFNDSAFADHGDVLNVLDVAVEKLRAA